MTTAHTYDKDRTQTEAELEQALITQLTTLGYQRVAIANEEALIENFKQQLEALNQRLGNLKGQYSEREFEQILNQVQRGNIFDKADQLRRRIAFTQEDGETKHAQLIDIGEYCQNHYQVANQITMEGKAVNRYDVTLLINGLPLVQIELKKRGRELKEAFNQTSRYQSQSYGGGYGLFQYIQIFVISNGVNTKYYANNRPDQRIFEQTFYWTDVNNKQITQLEQFTFQFLEPCHISKMITKYIVLNSVENMLMVLRPYQYYAVEAIIDRVQNSNKNGYIWHTTGSGKTLTSFKASQILIDYPEVAKVVFVVDRKDLDAQTTREFNKFKEGSVNSTVNTRALVEQFADRNTRLIVTTIQKLDIAIKSDRYKDVMAPYAEQKVVFIFDECHRSHFGATHQRIKSYFPEAQLFGFTGTPIFPKNAVEGAFGNMTTDHLFDKALHKYVITDAIRDGNVLKFSVEYFRRKGETTKSSSETNGADPYLDEVDDRDIMNHPDRQRAIAKYILNNHGKKTHSRDFNALFCVSSVQNAINYYLLFKELQEEQETRLNIATIFSYQANPTNREGVEISVVDAEDGFFDEESQEVPHNAAQSLEQFLGEYNDTFGTNFTTGSTESFDGYYQDVAKRVKNRQIDILIVVNMFLTGFDSKTLNTLYVDKNLRYHGLIQAFSRTNRIDGAVKSQGNILCFRNLKEPTEEAIQLFADKDAAATEQIIMPSYEAAVERFNEALGEFFQITPTVDSVNELRDEEERLEFVKAFRELMRLMNGLEFFSNFTFEDIEIDKQTFNDYKSKYRDLYEETQRGGEGGDQTTPLGDIDFEIELFDRANINVAYILRLLAQYKGETREEKRERILKIIYDAISDDTNLRLKRHLIEKFIKERLDGVEDEEKIPSAFDDFWNEERMAALSRLVEEQSVDKEALRGILQTYLYTGREPLRQSLINAMVDSPSLMQRKPRAEKLLSKIKEYIEVYIEGIG